MSRSVDAGPPAALRRAPTAPPAGTPAGAPDAADDALRASVLRAYGAGDAELPELLAYTRNPFDRRRIPPSLPLPDEPFVAAWEAYAAAGARSGLWAYLRDRLPQLRFPVAPGISRTEAYLAATRRGAPTAATPGLRLTHPDRLRLVLHPTAAGRIPVLIADAREDFVALVRAFVHRNEPAPVPDAMGACIVAGYNNWDRLHAERRRWERGEAWREHARWADAFRAIAARKELYQDRFIILSTGPYSATAAADLGLDEARWAAASLMIRLEHECAHYFTRRVFGSMKNALLDELIADYCGITAAAGRFRADWFLRFMGLERFPEYRAGGRLENYRGTPPLSERAFRVLQALVRGAATSLEAWDRTRPRRSRPEEDRCATLIALAGTTLEALAARLPNGSPNGSPNGAASPGTRGAGAAF